MTRFSNVLHQGNSSSRGQNRGKFKQHIFEKSPQRMGIIDSNLIPPLKIVLGLCVSPPSGSRLSSGPRAVHSHGAPNVTWDSILPFMGHCGCLDHSSLPLDVCPGNEVPRTPGVLTDEQEGHLGM